MSSNSAIDISIDTHASCVYLDIDRYSISDPAAVRPFGLYARAEGPPGYPRIGLAGALEVIYFNPNPFVPTAVARQWHDLGLAHGGDQNDWFWSVKAPQWLIIILLMLPGILYAVRFLARCRRKPGMCTRCGYDLRATPDRCPECGTLTTR